MDDLNNHNPLLDDDDNGSNNIEAVDSSNPLLDDEYDEDEDLSLLGIDVYNLDTGSNPWQRELVDGSPMDELDALPSLYDEDEPSPYSDEVARFNAKNGNDGHGEWVESSHLIPENYNDVNGDDFEDYIEADRDSGVNATVNAPVVEVVSTSKSSKVVVKDDDAFVSDSVAGDFDAEFGDLLGGDAVEVDETIVDSFDDILSTALKGIDDVSDKPSADSFSSSYDMDEDDDDDDQDRYAGFHIDKIISLGIDLDASDVHINADDMIAFTVLGDIRRVTDFGVIPAAVVQRIFADITSHVSQDNFARDLELDASYVLRDGHHKGRRTRLNVARSFGNVSMVFRIIANMIPTPASLGITDSLLDWCSLPNGLIMINGPTGTGKSTTLASLVRQIQLTRPDKIVTIEKPIEFVYGTDGMSFITQREVGGRDTRTFAGALTSAMRQAPDIIMLGEVRNQVEVNELLRAAETGHLAISTMHTKSAPATIYRIKSLYDGDDQVRILGSLSEVARGFANQILLKTPDGSGRFAVREVLNIDEDVSSLILQGDVEGIKNYQMENKITMEHELAKAVADGNATKVSARAQAPILARFDKIMKELEG